MTLKDKTQFEWSYEYSLKLETTSYSPHSAKRKRISDQRPSDLYYAATQAKKVVSHVYYHVEGNSNLNMNAQV